jgi:hypothetical protein
MKKTTSIPSKEQIDIANAEKLKRKIIKLKKLQL